VFLVSEYVTPLELGDGM